ncbi:hypothetical protein VPH35_051726 [Triticum aestivum]
MHVTTRFEAWMHTSNRCPLNTDLLEKEVAAVSPSHLFHRPLLRVAYPRPGRSDASFVGDAGWRWLRRGAWFFHMYIRVAVDLVRLGVMPWCGLMPVGIPAARPCEQSLVVVVVVSYLASMVEGTGGHWIWQYPSQ